MPGPQARGLQRTGRKTPPSTPTGPCPEAVTQRKDEGSGEEEVGEASRRETNTSTHPPTCTRGRQHAVVAAHKQANKTSRSQPQHTLLKSWCWVRTYDCISALIWPDVGTPGMPPAGAPPRTRWRTTDRTAVAPRRSILAQGGRVRKLNDKDGYPRVQCAG